MRKALALFLTCDDLSKNLDLPKDTKPSLAMLFMTCYSTIHAMLFMPCMNS